MRRISCQPLISWLCLIAFVANVLLQVGIVQCSDGHGGSHLELSCSQNDRKECVKSCGPSTGACEESDRRPHPCEDKPLVSGPAHLQAAPSQATLPTLLAPVFFAVIDPFRFDPPAIFGTRPLRPVVRPPDTLGRLRSVILTV